MLIFLRLLRQVPLSRMATIFLLSILISCTEDEDPLPSAPNDTTQITPLDTSTSPTDTANTMPTDTVTGLPTFPPDTMNAIIDSMPPSIPANLVASEVTDSSVTISWDASTDNYLVDSYIIYQNGVISQIIQANTLELANLIKDSTYYFNLSARDTAGNTSDLSDTLWVVASTIYTLVVEELPSNKVVYEYGNIKITVNPNVGGRIESLTLNEGGNFFLDEGVVEDVFGSTLWPAPQDEWSTKWGNWPPPSVLHSNPYGYDLTDNVLTMNSQPDVDTTNLQFFKEVHFDTLDTTFNITYEIKNIGNTSKTVSPWEITTVDKGGTAFFPIESFVNGTTDFQVVTSSTSNGIYWMTVSPSDDLSSESVSKIKADGNEGWMAYANDGILFIKKFTNISSSEYLPNEGEVQIYVDKDNDYLEVEQMGAQRQLLPDESLIYTVKWYVRSVDTSIGIYENATIVDQVRSIINENL